MTQPDLHKALTEARVLLSQGTSARHDWHERQRALLPLLDTLLHQIPKQLNDLASHGKLVAN